MASKALKLKKYPKRPKATASVPVLERYVQKCANIDRENGDRIKVFNDAARRRASAKAKIANLSGTFQRIRQKADKAKSAVAQIGFRRNG
jgi:hypothetical protein